MQSLGKEIQNILNACYNYKNSVTEGDRKEITFFTREIENCFPQFLAAGCINISHKSFLKVFAGLGTYYLALVELCKAFSKPIGY